GVEKYLVKPMEPEELVARIIRFFKLMKEWKSKRSGVLMRKGNTHTDTTADIGSRTNPTIHLPAESAKQEETSPSPAQSKDEKSVYGVYRTESVAGTGGMGLVYKAFDQSLDRYVAVK